MSLSEFQKKLLRQRVDSVRETKDAIDSARRLIARTAQQIDNIAVHVFVDEKGHMSATVDGRNATMAVREDGRNSYAVVNGYRVSDEEEALEKIAASLFG